MKNIIKKLLLINFSDFQFLGFSATKTIALVVVVSLLITTIGNNAYAVAQTINDIKKEENIASNFSEGKITSFKDTGSIATVVNIQDLHCHYQTQKSISNIIKEIDDNYGIKEICVEGGYGQIDTSWLSDIKDDKLKQTLTEKLLEEGELTGAEYYVIKNNKKNILKGLDEEKIHKENIKRLSNIIENENKYAKTIERVRYIISKLNKKYVNRRSRNFTETVNEYRQDKIDTAKYYSLLWKYIDKINEEPQKYNNIVKISKQDYPNISKYLQLTRNGNNVKTKQAIAELQQVLTELKQKLPYGQYSDFLADTKNLKQTDKLISYIQQYDEENKINLENYTQLNNFIKLKSINNSLNPVEMIKEESVLEDQIRKALSYNLTEYEVAYITSFEKYFEKYLNYGLTCLEWKYVETGMEKFRKLYTKYAVIDRIKEIEKDFDNINKYYQSNETRNSIFIDNITKYVTDNEKANIKQKRTAEQILKGSKDVIVVVSGGYHSEELSDMLSDKNINDIVITPNVLGDIDISGEKYKQIIKGQGKIQSQALAYTLASCATDNQQKEMLLSTCVKIIEESDLDNKTAFEELSKTLGIEINYDENIKTVTFNGDTNDVVKVDEIENTDNLNNKKSQLYAAIEAAIAPVKNVSNLKNISDFYKKYGNKLVFCAAVMLSDSDGFPSLETEKALDEYLESKFERVEDILKNANIDTIEDVFNLPYSQQNKILKDFLHQENTEIKEYLSDELFFGKYSSFKDKLYDLSIEFLKECNNSERGKILLEKIVWDDTIDLKKEVLEYLLKEENVNFIGNAKKEEFDFIIDKNNFKYLCFFIDSKISLSDFQEEIENIEFELSLLGETVNETNIKNRLYDVLEKSEYTLYLQYKDYLSLDDIKYFIGEEKNEDKNKAFNNIENVCEKFREVEESLNNNDEKQKYREDIKIFFEVCRDEKVKFSEFTNLSNITVLADKSFYDEGIYTKYLIRDLLKYRQKELLVFFFKDKTNMLIELIGRDNVCLFDLMEISAIKDLEAFFNDLNTDDKVKLKSLFNLLGGSIEKNTGLEYTMIDTYDNCFALEMFLNEDFLKTFEAHHFFKNFEGTDKIILLYLMAVDFNHLLNNLNLNLDEIAKSEDYLNFYIETFFSGIDENLLNTVIINKDETRLGFRDKSEKRFNFSIRAVFEKLGWTFLEEDKNGNEIVIKESTLNKIAKLYNGKQISVIQDGHSNGLEFSFSNNLWLSYKNFSNIFKENSMYLIMLLSCKGARFIFKLYNEAFEKGVAPEYFGISFFENARDTFNGNDPFTYGILEYLDHLEKHNKAKYEKIKNNGFTVADLIEAKLFIPHTNAFVITSNKEINEIMVKYALKNKLLLSGRSLRINPDRAQRINSEILDYNFIYPGVVTNIIENINENIIDRGVSVNPIFSLSIFLPFKNTKIGGILNKYAHVWENIFFVAPVVLTFFGIPFGIGMFAAVLIFLFSHTIVRWIQLSNETGERQLKTLVSFAIKDIKELGIPAIILTASYIIPFAIISTVFPLVPIITPVAVTIIQALIATIPATIFHYIWNNYLADKFGKRKLEIVKKNKSVKNQIKKLKKNLMKESKGTIDDEFIKTLLIKENDSNLKISALEKLINIYKQIPNNNDKQLFTQKLIEMSKENPIPIQISNIDLDVYEGVIEQNITEFCYWLEVYNSIYHFSLDKENKNEIIKITKMFFESVKKDNDIKTFRTIVNILEENPVYRQLPMTHIANFMINKKDKIKFLSIFGFENYEEFGGSNEEETLRKAIKKQIELFNIVMRSEERLKNIFEFFKGNEHLLMHLGSDSIYELEYFLDGLNGADKDKISNLIKILGEKQYRGIYTTGNTFALNMFLNKSFLNRIEKHPYFKQLQNKEIFLSPEIMNKKESERTDLEKEALKILKQKIQEVNKDKGKIIFDDLSFSAEEQKILMDANLLQIIDSKTIMSYIVAGYFTIWLQDIGFDFDKFEKSKHKDECLGNLMNKFFDEILSKKNLNTIVLDNKKSILGATYSTGKNFNLLGIKAFYKILGWDFDKNKKLVITGSKTTVENDLKNLTEEELDNGVLIVLDGHYRLGDGFVLESGEIVKEYEFTDWLISNKKNADFSKVTIYLDHCFSYNIMFKRIEENLLKKGIKKDKFPNFLITTGENTTLSRFDYRQKSTKLLGHNMDWQIQKYLYYISYKNLNEFEKIKQYGLTAGNMLMSEIFGYFSGTSIIIFNEDIENVNSETQDYLKKNNLLRNDIKTLSNFNENKKNAYLSLWDNIKDSKNPHRWYMIEEFLQNKDWFEQEDKTNFILDNEELLVAIIESLFPRQKLSDYLEILDDIISEGNADVLKENNDLLKDKFKKGDIQSHEGFKNLLKLFERIDSFGENKKLIVLMIYPLIENDKSEKGMEQAIGICNLLYENKSFIEQNSDWLTIVYEGNRLTFTETVKLIDSFINEENKEKTENIILNGVNYLIETGQKGNIVKLLSSSDYLFEYLDDENKGTIITENGIETKVDDKISLLLKKRNLEKLYENRNLFTYKEQKKIFKDLKVVENILKIKDFDKLNDVVKQMLLDGSIKSPANLKEYTIDFRGENLKNRPNPELKRNLDIAKHRNLNGTKETKILFDQFIGNGDYEKYKNYNDTFVELTGFTVEQIIGNIENEKPINGRNYKKGEILDIYRDDVVYAIAKTARENNIDFKDITDKDSRIKDYKFKCPIFDGPCLVPYSEILQAGYDIGDCTGEVGEAAHNIEFRDNRIYIQNHLLFGYYKDGSLIQKYGCHFDNEDFHIFSLEDLRGFRPWKDKIEYTRQREYGNIEFEGQYFFESIKFISEFVENINKDTTGYYKNTNIRNIYLETITSNSQYLKEIANIITKPYESTHKSSRLLNQYTGYNGLKKLKDIDYIKTFFDKNKEDIQKTKVVRLLDKEHKYIGNISKYRQETDIAKQGTSKVKIENDKINIEQGTDIYNNFIEHFIDISKNIPVYKLENNQNGFWTPITEKEILEVSIYEKNKKIDNKKYFEEIKQNKNFDLNIPIYNKEELSNYYKEYDWETIKNQIEGLIKKVPSFKNRKIENIKIVGIEEDKIYLSAIVDNKTCYCMGYLMTPQNIQVELKEGFIDNEPKKINEQDTEEIFEVLNSLSSDLKKQLKEQLEGKSKITLNLSNIEQNKDDINSYRKQLSIFLPFKNTKIGGILNKYAHVWENIFFVAPVVLTFFGIPFGIGMFAAVLIFLFSHTIVRWIQLSNETGERQLKTLVSFAIKDIKELGIPAIILTASYIIPFAIISTVFPLVPIITPVAVTIIQALIATIPATIFHKYWNNRETTIQEKILDTVNKFFGTNLQYRRLSIFYVGNKNINNKLLIESALEDVANGYIDYADTLDEYLTEDGKKIKDLIEYIFRSVGSSNEIEKHINILSGNFDFIKNNFELVNDLYINAQISTFDVVYIDGFLKVMVNLYNNDNEYFNDIDMEKLVFAYNICKDRFRYADEINEVDYIFIEFILNLVTTNEGEDFINNNKNLIFDVSRRFGILAVPVLDLLIENKNIIAEKNIKDVRDLCDEEQFIDKLINLFITKYNEDPANFSYKALPYLALNKNVEQFIINLDDDAKKNDEYYKLIAQGNLSAFRYRMERPYQSDSSLIYMIEKNKIIKNKQITDLYNKDKDFAELIDSYDESGENFDEIKEALLKANIAEKRYYREKEWKPVIEHVKQDIKYNKLYTVINNIYNDNYGIDDVLNILDKEGIKYEKTVVQDIVKDIRNRSLYKRVNGFYDNNDEFKELVDSYDGSKISFENINSFLEKYGITDKAVIKNIVRDIKINNLLLTIDCFDFNLNEHNTSFDILLNNCKLGRITPNQKEQFVEILSKSFFEYYDNKIKGTIISDNVKKEKYLNMKRGSIAKIYNNRDLFTLKQRKKIFRNEKTTEQNLGMNNNDNDMLEIKDFEKLPDIYKQMFLDGSIKSIANLKEYIRPDYDGDIDDFIQKNPPYERNLAVAEKRNINGKNEVRSVWNQFVWNYKQGKYQNADIIFESWTGFSIDEIANNNKKSETFINGRKYEKEQIFDVYRDDILLAMVTVLKNNNENGYKEDFNELNVNSYDFQCSLLKDGPCIMTFTQALNAGYITGDCTGSMFGGLNNEYYRNNRLFLDNFFVVGYFKDGKLVQKYMCHFDKDSMHIMSMEDVAGFRPGKKDDDNDEYAGESDDIDFEGQYFFESLGYISQVLTKINRDEKNYKDFKIKHVYIDTDSSNTQFFKDIIPSIIFANIKDTIFGIDNKELINKIEIEEDKVRGELELFKKGEDFSDRDIEELSQILETKKGISYKETDGSFVIKINTSDKKNLLTQGDLDTLYEIDIDSLDIHSKAEEYKTNGKKLKILRILTGHKYEESISKKFEIEKSILNNGVIRDDLEQIYWKLKIDDELSINEEGMVTLNNKVLDNFITNFPDLIKYLPIYKLYGNRNGFLLFVGKDENNKEQFLKFEIKGNENTPISLVKDGKKLFVLEENIKNYSELGKEWSSEEVENELNKQKDGQIKFFQSKKGGQLIEQNITAENYEVKVKGINNNNEVLFRFKNKNNEKYLRDREGNDLYFRCKIKRNEKLNVELIDEEDKGEYIFNGQIPETLQDEKMLNKIASEKVTLIGKSDKNGNFKGGKIREELKDLKTITIELPSEQKNEITDPSILNNGSLIGRYFILINEYSSLNIEGQKDLEKLRDRIEEQFGKKIKHITAEDVACYLVPDDYDFGLFIDIQKILDEKGNKYFIGIPSFSVDEGRNIFNYRSDYFNFTENHIAKIKVTNNNYYQIIERNKSNKKVLLEIVKNINIDSKMRLYALNYLITIHNVELAEEGIDIEKIKKDFVKQMFSKSKNIKNDFDLKAYATGIFLLISKENIYDDKNKKILEEIMKEAMLLPYNDREPGALANNKFRFVFDFYNDDFENDVMLCMTIAHELGHRIYKIYKPYGTHDNIVDTFNEVYADVHSNILIQEYDKEGGNVVFNLKDYIGKKEYLSSSSKNVISFVNSNFSKDIDWLLFADIIKNYFENDYSNISSKQVMDVAEDIVKKYKSDTAKKIKTTKKMGISTVLLLMLSVFSNFNGTDEEIFVDDNENEDEFILEGKIYYRPTLYGTPYINSTKDEVQTDSDKIEQRNYKDEYITKKLEKLKEFVENEENPEKLKDKGFNYAYLYYLYSDNKIDALKEYAEDTEKDLKYRLFAVMYLKILGEDITEDKKEKLKNDFKKEISNKKYRKQIINDFDLQAYSTGIMLIEEDNFIDTINLIQKNIDSSTIIKNMYAKISKSLFVIPYTSFDSFLAGDDSINASSASTYLSYSSGYGSNLKGAIAHELLHTFIEQLRKEAEVDLDNEIFLSVEEVLSNMAKLRYNNDDGFFKTIFKRFTPWYSEESIGSDFSFLYFVEEHIFSTSLIDLFMYTTGLIGIPFDGVNLSNAIIKSLFSGNLYKTNMSQLELRNKIFDIYLEDKYERFIKDFEKTINELDFGWQSVLYNALNYLKENDRKTYNEIIEQIKNSEIKVNWINTSYKYSKDIETRINNGDDKTIVSHIILAGEQPNEDILNIILKAIPQEQQGLRNVLENINNENYLKEKKKECDKYKRDNKEYKLSFLFADTYTYNKANISEKEYSVQEKDVSSLEKLGIPDKYSPLYEKIVPNIEEMINKQYSKYNLIDYCTDEIKFLLKQKGYDNKEVDVIINEIISDFKNKEQKGNRSQWIVSEKYFDNLTITDMFVLKKYNDNLKYLNDEQINILKEYVGKKYPFERLICEIRLGIYYYDNGDKQTYEQINGTKLVSLANFLIEINDNIENKYKLISLFVKLGKYNLDRQAILTDYNCLALKIFLNEDYNEIFENSYFKKQLENVSAKTNTDNDVLKYTMAVETVKFMKNNLDIQEDELSNMNISDGKIKFASEEFFEEYLTFENLNKYIISPKRLNFMGIGAYTNPYTDGIGVYNNDDITSNLEKLGVTVNDFYSLINYENSIPEFTREIRNDILTKELDKDYAKIFGIPLKEFEKIVIEVKLEKLEINLKNMNIKIPKEIADMQNSQEKVNKLLGLINNPAWNSDSLYKEIQERCKDYENFNMESFIKETKRSVFKGKNNDDEDRNLVKESSESLKDYIKTKKDELVDNQINKQENKLLLQRVNFLSSKEQEEIMKILKFIDKNGKKEDKYKFILIVIQKHNSLNNIANISFKDQNYIFLAGHGGEYGIALDLDLIDSLLDNIDLFDDNSSKVLTSIIYKHLYLSPKDISSAVIKTVKNNINDIENVDWKNLIINIRACSGAFISQEILDELYIGLKNINLNDKQIAKVLQCFIISEATFEDELVQSKVSGGIFTDDFFGYSNKEHDFPFDIALNNYLTINNKQGITLFDLFVIDSLTKYSGLELFNYIPSSQKNKFKEEYENKIENRKRFLIAKFINNNAEEKEIEEMISLGLGERLYRIIKFDNNNKYSDDVITKCFKYMLAYNKPFFENILLSETVEVLNLFNKEHQDILRDIITIQVKYDYKNDPETFEGTTIEDEIDEQYNDYLEKYYLNFTDRDKFIISSVNDVEEEKNSVFENDKITIEGNTVSVEDFFDLFGDRIVLPSEAVNEMKNKNSNKILSLGRSEYRINPINRLSSKVRMLDAISKNVSKPWYEYYRDENNNILEEGKNGTIKAKPYELMEQINKDINDGKITNVYFFLHEKMDKEKDMNESSFAFDEIKVLLEMLYCDNSEYNNIAQNIINHTTLVVGTQSLLNATLEIVKEHKSKIDISNVRILTNLMDNILTDSSINKAAILPENEGYVNKAIAEGKNSLRISIGVAVREFFKVYEVNKFYKGHKGIESRMTALILSSISYLVPAIIGITGLLMPAIPLTTVLIAFVISIPATNITVHTILDFKTIKTRKEMFNVKSGNILDLAMEEIEKQENVEKEIVVPMYVISEDLEKFFDTDDYDLINTGLKTQKGESIFSVKTDGAIVFGTRSGAGSFEVAEVLKDSKVLENLIKNKIGENINIKFDMVVEDENYIKKKAKMFKNSNIIFENDILITNEIKGKTRQEIINDFKTLTELKKAVGVTLADKIIISFENVADEELKQKLETGKARKVITQAQYDKLKEDINLLDLREQGIEIYIRNNNKITDIETGEEIEIEEEITEIITTAELQRKMVTKKSLLIGIEQITKIFEQSDILENNSLFETLIGNFKASVGIKQLINENVIKTMVYNKSFEYIPNEEPIQEEWEKLETENRIDDEFKKIFEEVMKERINAKKVIKQVKGTEEIAQNNKNKNLEKLLIKMINKQRNIDINQEQLSKYEDMNGEQLTEEYNKIIKDSNANIAKLIVLIPILMDEKKNKIEKTSEENDAQNYRAMLSAA